MKRISAICLLSIACVPASYKRPWARTTQADIQPDWSVPINGGFGTVPPFEMSSELFDNDIALPSNNT